MAASTPARTMTRTIIAQDPSVRDSNGIIKAQVEIPAEDLREGPWGHRVQVIDYDASTDTLYEPLRSTRSEDQYADASDPKLLSDPKFHCQNVYALVMRTLARFEFALGRRVSWGFYGHQLRAAPHAFADANAFYSEADHALMFGYFPASKGKGMVYTCLSHDVVVHETTHALLDGLRDRYTDPSSADQAAFHEGFADIVALLSVFSLPEVVGKIIDLASKTKDAALIRAEAVTLEGLRQSGILRLAEQMGQEIPTIRGNALRHSVELPPSPTYYKSDPLYEECHSRGEILVAAVLNAFLAVWAERVKSLGEIGKGYLSRQRVVEEGAELADVLLTVAIRALDYSPPVDIQFGDFLSALLTADREVCPVDRKYDLRGHLLKSFDAYGIPPASGKQAKDGTWQRPAIGLDYDCIHFEAMKRDPDEVFRFIWENRKALKLHEDAYSQVISVRPCVRIGPDGFALQETVVEFVQTLEVRADELARHGFQQPAGMPADTRVRLNGGNALIFDDHGRLKFDVHKRLAKAGPQNRRLAYLWKSGAFRKGQAAFSPFSVTHRQRALGTAGYSPEEW